MWGGGTGSGGGGSVGKGKGLEVRALGAAEEVRAAGLGSAHGG